MKTLQFTVTDDLHLRLKDEAWRRRLTMADTLRAVMNEHLPQAESGRVEATQASRQP